MPVPKKQIARARLGAVCVAASVVAGAITAPAAWSATTQAVDTVPDWEAPVAPLIPEDDSSDEDAATPAPGETVAPSPSPTDPSPPDGTPTPTPTPTSPTPTEPSVEPSPPAPTEPAPAPVPPRVDAEPESRVPTAVRLGALLGYAYRNPGVASPTPAPSDAVDLDGSPDVGGSAELGASVPAQDPTGRTDAVRVGSLHDGSGTELAQPAVWAPWGGALAVAGAAVVVLVLRGGRQIGR